MTTPVKMRSRGVSITTTASGSAVALPGLTSIEVGDYGMETYDSETLDGPVLKTKDLTGYSTPPEIKTTGYFDPVAYAAIEGIIAAPSTTVPTVYSTVITYTNSAATTETWNVVAYKLSKKIEGGKAVMCDLTMTTTG